MPVVTGRCGPSDSEFVYHKWKGGCNGVMEASQASEILRTADCFMASRVGPAGLVPESAHAFLALLRTPEAHKTFKNLLSKATLPGQLYALCGIYITDHQAFEGLAEPYTHLEDEVPTLAGCIGNRQRVCDLVDSKSPRALRLDYPTQTFAEWYQRHRGEHKLGWEVDIVGGGYPAEFLSLGDVG